MPNYVHGEIELRHFNEVVSKIRNTADDRTCGILAGAFLENLLFDLLDRKLPRSPVADHDALFKFNGALGSFANKIQLAHFMGLITVGDVVSLNVVKDIRNLCAHSLGVREDQIVDFKHPSILERLKKIYPAHALEKLSKEQRKQVAAVRDESLDVLGGRMFFTTFFCEVALSIFARLQVTEPFQLAEAINAHVGISPRPEGK